MIANSVIHFFKNDFALAIKDGDPNTVKIPKGAFIQQLPNETFIQKTSGQEGISFVAQIKVELICCCAQVKKDISDKFSYTGFVDAKGINQIDFEFGKVNDDFWTETLYLKITDLINGNVWYSNGFYVTEYNSHLSTLMTYTSEDDFENVYYSISPIYQNVRFQGVYYRTRPNETTRQQYTQTTGNIVNYKAIETKYKGYVVDKINNQTYESLDHVLRHPILYFDNKRVEAKEALKSGDTIGDTNWFVSGFIVNPQQGIYTKKEFLLKGLEVVSRYVVQNAYISKSNLDLNPIIKLTFNKNISQNLVNGFSGYVLDGKDIKYFFTFAITNNVASFDFNAVVNSFPFEFGTYSIIIFENCIYNELDFFKGYVYKDWIFSVVDTQYLKPSYNNDYL
jgi:hypothetical protein